MTYLAPVAPPVPAPSRASGPDVLTVAEALQPDLAQGFQIDALRLRLEMERAFGGSDADGAWDWKLAYEAGEVALVLFLRKFGRALLARAGSPAALLPILAKVAGLLPTHTRRSEEMERFQQFSTPLPMGLAALAAAQITPRDLVLEPSAGTGLLAILAEIAGGMDVALKLFGDVRDYPFDRYNSYLISTASDISTKNPAQTGLYIQDSKEVVPGFKVASELFSVSADDKASKKLIASTIEREQIIGITGVKWTIERSFDTVLTVLLMALLMILGAVVSTLITIAIVRGHRPPSLNSLGWLAAFLFAMFSLRTQLPGNPPNGILFDLWVFYPVVLVLVLLIAVTVTSWILREDWDMANPVVAIRGKRDN